MRTANQAEAKELVALESSELLRRILDTVERGRRDPWLEMVNTMVLTVAVLASAWCAFQSSQWGGVETLRLAAANEAARNAAAANFEALLGRSFDANMLLNYFQAKGQNDQRLERFLFDRFRPAMKVAAEAWLKTDPFNNPAAPQSPFKLKEYSQKELVEATRQHELARQMHADATQANR